MATMPTVSSVSTATSSTMTTLSNLMSKFLDNVNAGKFVTDIGPGLALTVPLLMLLAVLTESELVPAQKIPRLREEYQTMHAAIEREANILQAIIVADPTASDARAVAFSAERVVHPLRSMRESPSLPVLRTWTATENDAASAVLAVGAALETARRKLGGGASEHNFAQVERLAANQKLIETKLANFKAQREQLEKVRKNYTEAASVSKNLEIWEVNIALVAGLAVVLGVIIAQASRLVFFELLFPPFATIGLPGPTRDFAANRTKTAILKQSNQAAAAAYQDLVSNHLRYAEGAVNMAIPVLFFGAVYPWFAGTVSSVHSTLSIRVPAACFVIGVCMIIGGGVTYRRFRHKEFEWLKLNLDRVGFSAATSSAIKAAGDALQAATNAVQAAKSAEAAAAKSTNLDQIAKDIAEMKKKLP